MVVALLMMMRCGVWCWVGVGLVLACVVEAVGAALDNSDYILNAILTATIIMK